MLILCLLLASCGGGGGGSSSGAGPVAGENGGSGTPPGAGVDNPGPEPEPDPRAEAVRALAAAAGQDGSFRPASGPRPDQDAMVRLGQALFFSRTLSADYDTACASCHHPLLAGADALSLAVGVASQQPWHLGGGRQVDILKDQDPRRDCDESSGRCGPNVPRNSPTIFNSSLYSQAVLWDGRVESLGFDIDGKLLIRTPESSPVIDPQAGSSLLSGQARLPVVSANEMRGFAGIDLVNPDDFRAFVVRRLTGEEDGTEDYVTNSEAANWLSLFQAAWPAEVASVSDMRFEQVQEALAAYQASLVFTDTAWSRWLAGEGDISAEALEGARLFLTPLGEGGFGCAGCHTGPRMTDEQFHNVGFPQIGRGRRSDSSDPGREDVTRNGADRFAFRTPSLLNVALTAPYGHAGTFQTLEDLLRYHAQPTLAGFESAWANLAQFQGRSLLSTYPGALDKTTAILASDTLASDRLPMTPLSDEDIVALTAFLQLQTDACAGSAACVSQWVPSSNKMPAGDDPDGNQLTMGQPSEIDFETPPGGEDGAVTSMALTYREPLPRTSFQENQGLCLSLAVNTGLERFVSSQSSIIVGPSVSLFPVPDVDLGPDFSHGFAAEDWFIASFSSVEPVMFAGGVTATYLDGDCWPDLVFSAGTQGGGLRFYTSRNGWYFNHRPDLLDWDGVRPLGGYITGVAVADLDGDYRRELITGNLLASAAADELTHESRDSIVVLGQMDDGTLYRAGALSLRRNTFGISFADVDGDSDLDMFTAHWGFGQPAGGSVFWQNLDGDIFSDAQNLFGLSDTEGLSQQYNFTPSFVDANNDGWQDLLLASDFATSQVLQNVPVAGGRRFQKVLQGEGVITDENGMGAAVGDYDNDGDPDWFVTAIYYDDPEGSDFWGNSGNGLYRNDSDADNVSVEDATEVAGVRDGAWGWGACMADFNNDGWLDLFHENGFSYIPPDYASFSPGGGAVAMYQNAAGQFAFSPPRLFINQGNGSGEVVFRESALDWGIDFQSNGRSALCIDFDRDGDIDIFTLDHSGAPRVLVNHVGHGAGHRYLSIRLIGASPNTEAIGARIRVTADTDGSGAVSAWETQTRWVQANATFNSQPLPDQHFGLGSAASANIEIVWPGDDTPLQCSGVSVNRFLVFDQRSKSCP